ncbi:MAG: hypothetical protein QGG36_14455 [Pirellulaceae bacterium]|nr:hypothetical protein [Pirellulaceae bacterium]MDP7017003.1 hypothetical protein [Pirellulaceae bacterium]
MPTWPRFSLRTLIVVAVIFALLLGWMGIRYDRIRREEAIAVKLEQFGGSAAFRHRRIVQVSFSGDRFSPDALKYFGDLPLLERVSLIDTTVDDEALLSLAALIRLREVLVLNAPITDKGVARLKELPQLEKLWLAGTGISNEGLKHLTPIVSLKHLNLNGTEIGDDGMQHITPLRSLERLNVENTDLTVVGVSELIQAMPNARIEHSVEEPIP